MKRIKSLLMVITLIISLILTLKVVNATETKLSGINYLKSLNIAGTTINFKSEVLEYDLIVPYGQEKLVINYTKGHEKQTVDILGGPNLYIGNNSIVVKVTAEDKTIRNYNLTIRRKSDGIETQNNIDAILNSIVNYSDSKIYLRLYENEKAEILNSRILKELKTRNKILYIEWLDSKNYTVLKLKINGSDIENVNQSIDPNIKDTITNKKILKVIEKEKYIAISTKNTNIPSNSEITLKVSDSASYYLVNLNKLNHIQRMQLRQTDSYITLSLEKESEYAIVTGILNDVLEEELNLYPWLFPTLLGIIAVLVFLITGLIVYRKK